MQRGTSRKSRTGKVGGIGLTMTSTRFAAGTSWRTLARAFSRAGAEISAMRTLAPSLANRMLVSRPMPLASEVSTLCKWRSFVSGDSYISPTSLHRCCTIRTPNLPSCAGDDGILSSQTATCLCHR